MTAALPEDEQGRRVIRIGHSPDPDDAFMFHALTNGLIDTPGYRFIHVLEDIESLNHKAMNCELEVSAISIHSYPGVAADYALMNCGASMGEGYGPMVVAKQGRSRGNVTSGRIAVPGYKTSAYLGLRLAWGEVETVVIPFDHIIEAIETGVVNAGLIIHEGQLTYSEYGLEVHLDLGQWWSLSNQDLPLPLGGNIVRRDLGEEVMEDITRWTRMSIEHAIAQPEEALRFARSWGRGIDAETNRRFVDMYVNQRTLDYGVDGRRSVRRFLELGQQAGLVDAEFDVDSIEFIGAEVTD